MQQNGAATLLMALVLMTSASVITFAVARSHIVEQRITSNSNWHARLRLAAEEGLARGLVTLDENIDSLVWKPLPAGGYISTAPVSGSAPADVITEIAYIRTATPGKFITIQSIARGNAISNMIVRINQQVRPLSILTPAAEHAPPLVLAGCLTSSAAGFHIRPINADSSEAGDAAWMKSANTCLFPANIDIHNGSIRRRESDRDLWNAVFSVSREQFTDLATADLPNPVTERRYWSVDADTMPTGKWTRSLGNEKKPIVLYFPASNACPEFGPGVQIHGLVFIDTDCPLLIGNTSLTIYGSLVVNGDLNVLSMQLQLNHIQQANDQLTGLELPVLRSVPVPGTWKDF